MNRENNRKLFGSKIVVEYVRSKERGGPVSTVCICSWKFNYSYSHVSLYYKSVVCCFKVSMLYQLKNGIKIIVIICDNKCYFICKIISHYA